MVSRLLVPFRIDGVVQLGGDLDGIFDDLALGRYCLCSLLRRGHAGQNITEALAVDKEVEEGEREER